jgi:xanthine dehydrogenase YagR molybdenum-binding subunit
MAARWCTFVGEFDEQASPLGTKGLGKLTAVSVAPAIANAVHHDWQAGA